tara:strand:- start:170 stop:448 length:279 start_codon:yes stop_codon:yes gene_type:complete
MESIYFNNSGKNDEDHSWDRIYKKSDKIYHETYKYRKIEVMDEIVENYVHEGYVLDKIKPIDNLIILRKDISTIYLWPKSKDIEEIRTERLH